MTCKEKVYMWGYQRHYYSSAKCAAEGIFKLIDAHLHPKVFLVGISTFNDERIPTACLEPEDECGYSYEIFSNVMTLAREFESNDEDIEIFHSHPQAQISHLKRINLKSLQRAITTTIEADNASKDVTTFCSTPVEVKGFMICVVLQFNKSAFQSHYCLINGVIERYPIAKSLLDATIYEYLNGCFNALQKPEPGSCLSIIDREYDEVIRAAGKRLMQTPAWAGYAGHGLYGLFETCNIISSLKYEGIDARGGMIITAKSHPNVNVILSLHKPIYIRDYRAVRKILEIASDKYYMLSDADYIYGLAELAGNYNSSDENLFIINFNCHYHWELSHNGNSMMDVIYGQPSLPYPPIDVIKFNDSIKRIFNLEEVHKNLCLLAEEATRQKHGAMLIITNGAKEEAERLSRQSTEIAPIPMTVELYKMVSGIDGGVLIDPDGICYAIGVILDGIATPNGDPSRGSRYNSAVRYVEATDYNCFIVSASEDGMVNFVPDLRPQIKRSEIIIYLQDLKALLDEQKVHPKEFNQIMSWFNEHSFYLPQEICLEINDLRKAIEPNLDTNLWIVYNDFSSKPEMNDSFFLPE